MNNTYLNKATLNRQTVDEFDKVGFLLSLSKDIGQIRDAELKNLSLQINVISIAARGKLKETAHSLILQNLLKNQTILDSFKDNILGLTNLNINAEKVQAAEKDRIDISINDKENNIYIIIENKVNNAEEKCGQIYRYVQTALKEGYSNNQIIVLYLNSIGKSKPSDYSLTKNGKGYISIDSIIGKNMIIKDYANDIYRWINEEYEKILSNLIHSKDKFMSTEWSLATALFQYKTYLERHFYITNDYEKMKQNTMNKIKSIILKDLDDFNDNDASQRIEKLNDTLKDIDFLRQNVLELIERLKNEKILHAIRSRLIDLKLTIKEIGNDEWGISLVIYNNETRIVYGYDYDNNNNAYIGLNFGKKVCHSAKEIDFICNELRKLNYSGDFKKDDWIYSEYVNKKDLINKFCHFAKDIVSIFEVHL